MITVTEDKGTDENQQVCARLNPLVVTTVVGCQRQIYHKHMRKSETICYDMISINHQTISINQSGITYFVNTKAHPPISSSPSYRLKVYRSSLTWEKFLKRRCIGQIEKNK